MKSILITPITVNGEVALSKYYDDCESKNYKAWGMNLFQFRASQVVTNKYLVSENLPDRIMISLREGTGYVVDLGQAKDNILKVLFKFYHISSDDVEVTEYD